MSDEQRIAHRTCVDKNIYIRIYKSTRARETPFCTNYIGTLF